MLKKERQLKANRMIELLANIETQETSTYLLVDFIALASFLFVLVLFTL